MRVEIKLENANYVVDITDESYNVFKIGTIESEKSENYGKAKETILGYCVSMDSALKTIIRNKLANNDEVVSLKDFILKIEQYNDELKSFANK